MTCTMDFSELVTYYLARDPDNEEKLARRFNVSKPTIIRWTNGDNKPHSAIRPTVVKWIETELDTNVVL